MAKKPSGLGRGLGDLLDDNAPQITSKTSSKVVLRAEEKKVSVSGTSELYESKPKNKSLKANYR